MIIHFLKCEVCDAQIPHEQSGDRPLPQGWMQVYKENLDESGYHFCSLAHLEQWASKINAPLGIQMDLDDIFSVDLVTSHLSHYDSYVSAHLLWASKNQIVYLDNREEKEAKALAIGLLWQRYSQEIIARIRGAR